MAMAVGTPRGSNQAKGWLFVAIQMVLLGALILLPTGNDWQTPETIRLIGGGAVAFGLVVVAAAALKLGGALTPTPIPNDKGQLQTVGLYRLVRHPIYTGVLIIVIGLALRSESWLRLAVALTTVAFFHIKARWEETHLNATYPKYRAYADRTPRFVPSIRRPISRRTG